MGMNVNDFWTGFNVVNDAIMTRRKLGLAEQREQRMAEQDAEELKWKREDRQRENQRLELSGLQARIESGTATPEELTAARKQYLPGSKGMAPMGVIGPQATPQQPQQAPAEWDGEKALEDLARQRTEIVTRGLGKLEAARQAGQAPQLDEGEARAMIDTAILSPAFDDEDMGKQHAALQTIEAYLGNLGRVPGKVKLDDPAVLDAVATAYPQIVNGSNLKGARPSAVYIDPSPDGDPMKAKIMVGITGKNDRDEDVDGILTERRTSDPDDTVIALSSGEWLTMAEGKRQILDGVAAARVALGDDGAWKAAKAAREAREIAKVYDEKAAEVEEPKLQQRLKLIAAQVKLGAMNIDTARKIAEDIYPVKADEKLSEILFRHKLDMEKEDRRDDREAMREDRRDKRLTMQLGSMERRAASHGGGRGQSDVEFRQSKAAARKEIDMTFRDMNDTKKAAEREFAQQKQEESYGMPPDWTAYNQLRAEYNEKRRNYERILQGYTDDYGDVYAPGAVRKERGGMAPKSIQHKPDVNEVLFGGSITATNPKTGERIISHDNGRSWQPIGGRGR